MKIDFMCVPCFDMSKLKGQGENPSTIFLEWLAEANGLPKSSGRIFIHTLYLGILIADYDSQISYGQITHNGPYWFGTLDKWKTEIIVALTVKNHPDRILYSGVYKYIVENIYKHTFWEYRQVMNDDNTIRLVPR